MTQLQPDTTFHIFNHSNGFENVFREPENYRYFMEKYRLYISPIAETYAYCLMPNHFHLVVRIRKREVIEKLIQNKSDLSTTNLNLNFSKVQNFGEVEEIKNISNYEIEKYLSKQFSNLFSCYTQSFNKVYKRMGSLFIKNFKREPITDKTHFINAIIYTHRNPIHHGFCNSFDDWEYSSYNEISAEKAENIVVEKLFKIFGSKLTFKESHQQNIKHFSSIYEFDMP